jgi:MFS family permease
MDAAGKVIVREELSVDPVQKRSRLRRELWRITFAWVMGSVWLTAISGTPNTNFARSLHASEFQFGVMAALPFIASLISLPASFLTEATGKRKRIFLWGSYFQRLMWVPIAILPVLMVKWYGQREGAAAMRLFLSLMFIMHAGGTLGGTAWVSWMADIVPARVRGKYFARRRQWGIVTAIPTAFVVGWLLDHYTTGGGEWTMLTWCAGVFVISTIFGTADIAIFHAVRDVPKPPQWGRGLLAAMKQPLKDRNFLWFAGFVATLVFAVSFMGQFVTLYIIDQLGGASGKSVNIVTQLMLIIAPSIAQLFLLPVWGHAADRMGKRPILILAGLGLVPVGIGWCFVTREHIWLGYLLSAAGAALWAGVEVANLNLVLEMAGGEEQGGTGYVAVNSVIINIAGCFGGLASGVIAQVLKNHNFAYTIGPKTLTFYDILFILSGLLRLFSVVIFVPHVREAHARPTVEALRYMTANIYNNLFSAALAPLRMLGFNRAETYRE